MSARKSNEMEVGRDLVKKNRKVEQKVDNESEKADPVSTTVQNPNFLSSIYNYLVVLSIILIIFAAFRNTVTW